MWQRNLKVNDELEGYAKKQAEINRNIINLHNKVAALNEQLCKKKNSTNNLLENNSLQRVDYVTKLKVSRRLF